MTPTLFDRIAVGLAGAALAASLLLSTADALAAKPGAFSGSPTLEQAQRIPRGWRYLRDRRDRDMTPRRPSTASRCTAACSASSSRTP